MVCKICGREAADKYCELHEKAYRNVVENYEAWKKALDVSWEEYLNEVMKNPYAGMWAKEVAKELMRSEERGEQKN